MMIINKKIVSFALLFSFLSVFAADYKTMSIDKLMNLRGKVPVQDIEIYGEELTKRVKDMTSEDYKKFRVSQQIGGTNNKQTGHVCNALRQRPSR